MLFGMTNDQKKKIEIETKIDTLQMLLNYLRTPERKFLWKPTQLHDGRIAWLTWVYEFAHYSSWKYVGFAHNVEGYFNSLDYVYFETYKDVKNYAEDIKNKNNSDSSSAEFDYKIITYEYALKHYIAELSKRVGR